MSITTDRAIWQAESAPIELLQMTIGDLLDQQATRFSEQEALVYASPEHALFPAISAS